MIETKESVNTEVPNGNSVDIEDKPVEELSVNERLLLESKKYKKQYQQYKDQASKLKAELDKIEQEKLEAQGKEAERAKYWETRYKDLNDKVLRKTIDDSIKQYEQKSGCIDPDAVIRLGEMSNVQYDEETGEVSGVEVMLDELKQKRPYLFSQPKTPVINPSIPGMRAVPEVDKHKNFGKLPLAERNKLLVEAMMKKK